MNTPYSNKLAKFRQFGLTLMVGDKIGSNTVFAMQQAYILSKQKEYGEVMYLNTYQSDEVLDETCAKAIHRYFTINTQEDITIVNSTVGDLANERGKMARHLHGEFKSRVIVINSWEFAASDYRLRNKLLFMINEWITHYGVSVIVYIENPNRAIELGKIQRYGLGKLTAMANTVVNLCELPVERDEQFVEYEQQVIEREARQEAIAQELESASEDTLLELTNQGVRDHNILPFQSPYRKSSRKNVHLHNAKTAEQLDAEFNDRDKRMATEEPQAAPRFVLESGYEAKRESMENELESTSVLC